MLTPILDWLRGSGHYSVDIPPMDGVLKPNDEIDRADVVAEIAEPDNLLAHQGRLLLSSRGALCRVPSDSGEPLESVATFGSLISCLASDGADGLAIGLEEGRILIQGGAFHGQSIELAGSRPVNGPTACVFKSPSVLVFSLGSTRHLPSRWKWDLMSGGRSGSVWELDLKTRACRCLADNLGFPNGLLVMDDGSTIVSESWRHRLIRLGDRIEDVVDDLPAYPGRLARGEDGGVLLAAFAPRRQMVEFVLREPAFRKRMMEEIPEAHWMAPALSSGADFLEPLQGGQVRHLGVLKPWAPTKSYGLVIRMSPSFHFVRSLHSRAGGQRHGVTSCVDLGGRLHFTSRGGHCVLVSEHG